MDGELRYGTGLGPDETTPLTSYDYGLFSVEVFENRDDWEKLTAIQEPFQEALRAVMDPPTEGQAIHHLRTAMLNARQSPELTGADKRRVVERLREQFEQAKQGTGERGIRGGDKELQQVMRYAMPVNQALEKGVPTVEEIFAATSFLRTTRAMPSAQGREMISDVLMPEGGERATATLLSQASRFYFLLEGEAVKENRVQYGANVDLIFNYDLLPLNALAEVSGKKLEALLAQQNLDLGMTIVPRGFIFRDGIHYQPAKFRGGKLESSVRFKLKANDRPVGDAGVHVTFDQAGSSMYEFYLPIELVSSVDQVGATPTRMPISLNLDEVLAAKDRLGRVVNLYLWAEGDQLSFLFHNHVTGVSYGRKLRTLTRSALADKVGKVRGTLAPVTDHVIWSVIGDRIAEPTAHEQKAFEECLELVVDAGASLYAALAADEDFKDVLQRIDELGPDSRLSITTDCAFLPWEILYPRRYDTNFTPEVKAENPIQVQEIWGYRFTIECLLMGKSASYKPPLEAHSSGKLFVSYNLNPTIDEKFQEGDFKPVQAQERWAKESESLMVKVDLKKNGQDIKRGLQTKNYEATLIYLYCHGRNDHPFLEDQTEMLELDKGVTIEPDFLNDGIPFACGPLVFLNSCSSGAFSPLSFSNFLSRFREKQALGLIATSFPVPASFAAAFGHQVIEGYIQDRHTPIGVALLNLRRKLLNQKNPLGLFYSLQCPMDVTAPPLR